jgi:ribosomal protein L37AE/L43A
MGSNYPPGVTGNEYEIAGPDFEEEVECSECGKLALKQGYRNRWWIDCEECGYHEDGQTSMWDLADYYFESAGDR